MTSHTFPRALTALALLLVPLAAACFENDDNSVGTDVDSGTSGSGSGASDASAGCATENIVCNEPNIPVGCHLGESKCVNGVYECPGVVCPGDSGTCTGSEVCSEPNIPAGCHLGASSCENGRYVCPPVVCPGDSGACTGPLPPCAAPPPGCQAGSVSCVNGTWECGSISCDAGAAGDGGECIAAPVPMANDLSCESAADCTLVVQGNVCKDGCYCPTVGANTTFAESEQSIIAPYETVNECACPAEITPQCISGKCTTCGGSGQPACADAGTGTNFACADATCDAATQYCVITQGGAVQPDGSTNRGGVCDSIPSDCANDPAGSGAECACLQQASSGTTCSNVGDQFTVYRDVP